MACFRPDLEAAGR